MACEPRLDAHFDRRTPRNGTLPIRQVLKAMRWCAAGVALLDMSAERRRAAALDGAHDVGLHRGQAIVLRLPPGRTKWRKMSATSRVGRPIGGRYTGGNCSRGLITARSRSVATCA